MDENQIWKDVKSSIANSIEQADLTADQIRKKAKERVDEFKDKIILIKEQNYPREKYLQELETLVKQFNKEKNDDEARKEKEDKPEQFTGRRNRFIIKAELDAHLNNFDDNWTKNIHHANGKYTSEKEKEWIAKKEKLEKELQNSPN